MELPLLKTTTAAGGESGLASRLRERVRGDVRFDPLARTLYATDASIYEITPVGVVMPKCVEDVVATVRIAAEHGVTVTPRGAATGLTGGAVGGGVQVDLSRHMNRILDIDPAGRTATVEPGVVLDELNATVAPHGLHFAPDVATASRATIGGMIANNSCGAHSIVHGRTVDHVLELTIVLADGSVVTFGKKGARESGKRGRGTEFQSRTVRRILRWVRKPRPLLFLPSLPYSLTRSLPTRAASPGRSATFGIVTPTRSRRGFRNCCAATAAMDLTGWGRRGHRLRRSGCSAAAKARLASSCERSCG